MDPQTSRSNCNKLILPHLNTFCLATNQANKFSEDTVLQLIDKLENTSYSIRQDATRELLKRSDAVPALRLAVNHEHLNIANRAIEILDDLEFRSEMKVFNDLGDYESLEQLKSLKHALLEDRRTNKEVYPDPSIAESVEKLITVAQLYQELDVNTLLHIIKSTVDFSKENHSSHEDKMASLTKNILGSLSAISSSTDREISISIVNSLKRINWSEYSPGVATDLIEEICSAYLSETINRTELREILVESGFDARGILGLTKTPPLVAEAFNMNGSGFFLNKSTKEMLSIYNKDTNEYSQALLDKNLKANELTKLGELIYLNKKFLDVVEMANSPFHEPTKSEILQPLVDSWVVASKERDLAKMRSIIIENADILSVCKANNIPRKQQFLCLYIDNILRDPKISSSDKENGLGSIVTLNTVLLGQLTSKEDRFDQATYHYQDDLKNEVIDALNTGGPHSTPTLADLSRSYKSISALKFFVWDLGDTDLPPELKDAFLNYLGTDLQNLDQNLGMWIEDDCTALTVLLDKFDTENFKSPFEIQHTYLGLMAIQNNLFMEYSGKEVGLARQSRIKLLDAIRSGDKRFFDYHKESVDLLDSIGKRRAP